MTGATQNSRTILYFLKLPNVRVGNHNKRQLNIYKSNSYMNYKWLREKNTKKFLKGNKSKTKTEKKNHTNKWLKYHRDQILFAH